MKTLIKALALSLAVATPILSFAQDANDSLTRAQVEGQLIQLEHAGYRQNRSQYPADIQAAEARVAAQSDTGYGGMPTSTSQSSDHVTHHTWNTEYGHH
ncbi:DUF4148 domain-containing protein [Paraburkholderia tagetis]|uniref:DUF4148 domain-containing protein n=1 Tax=Paraburkholderia tagetis TaxID=2913261 RepID=A0A9X1UHZ0_9BURK|nr:DUF4148 domain-containing protein [Paraburkholderia tagetis]MCG5076930.1 DUF4148 domain-containing protein [Paraburkholderia tagetis]